MFGLSESQELKIAGSQFFKCANKPSSNLPGLEDHECHLWKIKDEYKGSFDEYGYKIDHIIETNISGDDSEKNLQALCYRCYAHKTKKFMRNNIQEYKLSIEKEKTKQLKLKIKLKKMKLFKPDSSENSDSENSDSENSDSEDNDSENYNVFATDYNQHKNIDCSDKHERNKQIIFYECKKCDKLFAKKDMRDIHTKNCKVRKTITNGSKSNHRENTSDLKSSYEEVYENKQWVKEKIDEILERLVDLKTDDLDGVINDMEDFLGKKARQKIKNAIENIDYSKPGYRKKLRLYLRPILYNHKDMIIKTRKLTKEQEELIFKKEQEEAELEAKIEEESLVKNLKKK